MISNAGSLLSGATLYVRAVGGANGEYVSNPVSIEMPNALSRNDLDESAKMQQVSFVEFNSERSTSVSYNSELEAGNKLSFKGRAFRNPNSRW